MRKSILVPIVASCLAPLFSFNAIGQPAAPAATQPVTAPNQGAASPAAQPAAPSAEPATMAVQKPSFDDLTWLRGCWGGRVGHREFGEQWQQAKDGVMLGRSETLVRRQMKDDTSLRIESRSDGLYYVAIPSGKKELAFKLTGIEDEKGVKVFTFSGQGADFPQRIVYRRTGDETMFAQVAGKIDGKDKEVTYPMHRVDCAAGALPRD
jgi:hypothetical protein